MSVLCVDVVEFAGSRTTGVDDNDDNDKSAIKLRIDMHCLAALLYEGILLRSAYKQFFFYFFALQNEHDFIWTWNVHLVRKLKTSKHLI